MRKKILNELIFIKKVYLRSHGGQLPGINCFWHSFGKGFPYYYNCFKKIISYRIKNVLAWF